MGIKTFLIILCWTPWVALCQWGCTDTQAANYNPNASINDGSCLYPVSSFSPILVNNLTDTIQENSGLIRVGNLLYTFNDSGSGSLLYEIDTLGNVIRSIVVAGASNVDWEAITNNASHVFIGDFGNNNGNRNNLCIYRFALNELTQDTVFAEKLPFVWSDQQSFASLPNANNFDCEAFFAKNDSLALFSKNWGDLKTRYYTLPVFWADTAVAMLQDSLNIDGLITDACYDSTSKKAYLLGYKNNGNNFYTSFIWMLWDYPNTHLLKGNKRRIELGNVLTLSQTEGIALRSSNDGYISSEKVVSVITISPKLFRFDLSSFYLQSAGLSSFSMESDIEISCLNAAQASKIHIKSNFQSCELRDLQNRLIQKITFPTSEFTTEHHGIGIIVVDGKSRLFLLP